MAWKLSREQVGSSAGEIADVKPTASYAAIGSKEGIDVVERTRKSE
ncbi:MAG: hypothetical protein ACREHD_27765 [Pirellulales bacterium]